MRFRDDILRGVRLFAIVFALILIAVWIYRMVRAQPDVRGASPDVSAVPETAQPVEQKTEQPAPKPAPASDAVAESHGLTVPPPPPVAGAPAPRIARQRVAVKPAAPVATQPANAVASANRAPVPSGPDFELSQPSMLPVAAPAVSSDPAQAPSKEAVGYKSLLETNANRVTVIHQAQPPVEESTEQPAKGKRLIKAVGKIFHTGVKQP